MTPLLAAAVTGHIHIVEYLIADPDLVSRKEKIDALELLGATFVDKKRDMLGSYKLWKRAMEDRCVHNFLIMSSNLHTVSWSIPAIRLSQKNGKIKSVLSN